MMDTSGRGSGRRTGKRKNGRGGGRKTGNRESGRRNRERLERERPAEGTGKETERKEGRGFGLVRLE